MYHNQLLQTSDKEESLESIKREGTHTGIPIKVTAGF